MTRAIIESRIFQKIGCDINLEADFAPKPIAVNQMKLASIAPITKNHLSVPNWLEILPSRITVSR
jgi:hypothetical protein